MKKVSCFNKYLALILILATVFAPTALADITNEETIIIAPENLEGIPGGAINVSDIFVQKITLYEVRNITNIEIVDDNGAVLKLFPKEKYKATVREVGTKESLGFINLIPVDIGNKIATSYNYSGEFLFYQNGRIFNKLKLSEEGKIYFYQQGKTAYDRPEILDIGDISNGEFTFKDYVIIVDNIITLRRN